jgi:hypothetical protein
MPVTLRAAKNYLNALAILPVTALTRQPVEGPKALFAEISWGEYSPGFSVHMNISQFGTDTFSQISAVSVDNSACGTDVQFIFTDTQETLTIPAGSPKDIVPVVTNNREFYIQTTGTTVTGDVTRFSVLNFVPPPIAVPISEEQNYAIVGAIAMSTASTPVVEAGVNGTLENLNINLAVNATNSGDGTWTLEDGSGNVIASGAVSFSAGDKYNLTLFEQSNLRLRFINGLNFVCTETAILGAVANVNLYYRTP